MAEYLAWIEEIEIEINGNTHDVIIKDDIEVDVDDDWIKDYAIDQLIDHEEFAINYLNGLSDEDVFDLVADRLGMEKK